MERQKAAEQWEPQKCGKFPRVCDNVLREARNTLVSGAVAKERGKKKSGKSLIFSWRSEKLEWKSNKGEKNFAYLLRIKFNFDFIFSFSLYFLLPTQESSLAHAKVSCGFKIVEGWKNKDESSNWTEFSCEKYAGKFSLWIYDFVELQNTQKKSTRLSLF